MRLPCNVAASRLLVCVAPRFRFPSSPPVLLGWFRLPCICCFPYLLYLMFRLLSSRLCGSVAPPRLLLRRFFSPRLPVLLRRCVFPIASPRRVRSAVVAVFPSSYVTPCALASNLGSFPPSFASGSGSYPLGLRSINALLRLGGGTRENCAAGWSIASSRECKGQG